MEKTLCCLQCWRTVSEDDTTGPSCGAVDSRPPGGKDLFLEVGLASSEEERTTLYRRSPELFTQAETVGPLPARLVRLAQNALRYGHLSEPASTRGRPSALPRSERGFKVKTGENGTDGGRASWTRRSILPA